VAVNVGNTIHNNLNKFPTPTLKKHIFPFIFNMVHPFVLYQYIITQVRQQTQQYLEIVILVNIYGYMFQLILS